jgi:23S rRNA (cytosine1962-C5)-methyltransferase
LIVDLIVKAGKERALFRRHPWVYSSAVDRLKGSPQSGHTVRVVSAEDKFLSWAAYSAQSQIRARCWSFDESDVIDAAWFARKVSAAVARRAVLEPMTNGLRLVFGEADGLPGLVVDRYRDWLVVQFLAAGVDYWRKEICAALILATGIENIYERSDAAVREREGLPSRSGPIPAVTSLKALDDSESAPLIEVEIEEHGVRYGVDIAKGHKTGFYLDQRDNRHLLRQLCEQRVAVGERCDVLNCFSYTGGFALAALKGGATYAESIDSSADALANAARNLARNGFVADAGVLTKSDVSERLKALLAEGRTFDLIVLDPPKFAPSSQHVERAARAYKDLNMRAMRLLAPNGLLLTFSCSGAISVELFQKIVAGAVADVRMDFSLLRRLEAGIDHPMSMAHPEGEYLKGLLLRKLG